jgi:hypothetical protein
VLTILRNAFEANVGGKNGDFGSVGHAIKNKYFDISYLVEPVFAMFGD